MKKKQNGKDFIKATNKIKKLLTDTRLTAMKFEIVAERNFDKF